MSLFLVAAIAGLSGFVLGIHVSHQTGWQEGYKAGFRASEVSRPEEPERNRVRQEW